MDYQQALPILVPALALLLGIGIGRWWVLVFPVAAWALFFTGFEAGFWGYGFAEGWAIVFFIHALIGIGAAGAGLLVRHGLLRGRGTTSRRSG